MKLPNNLQEKWVYYVNSRDLSLRGVRKMLLGRFAHPGGYRLTHTLFEGQAEGAVAVVTAFVGQLLDGERLLSLDNLLIAADEVVDAQIVDIGIVCNALT